MLDVNKILRGAGFGGEDYGKIVRATVGYAQAHTDATKADVIAFAAQQAAPKPVKINMLEKARMISLFPPAGGAFERGAMDQMDTVARLPVYLAGALMPDAHQGYAMPVGGVANLENAIAPWLVGVDIGCGMTVLFFQMANDDSTRFYVERAVKYIGRFGRNVCDEPQDHPILHDPLWQTNPVLKGLHAKACAQLGSSGSGNHFLAINRVDGYPNLFALILHSGSRGTGAKVADYYCKLAEVACPANVAKGYGYFAFDSDEGQEYYAAMNLMAEWARVNHQIIIGRFIALAKDYIQPLDAADMLFVHANAYVKDALAAQQRVDVKVRTSRGQDRFQFTVLQNFHNIAIKVGETADGKAILRHHKGSTPAKAGQYGIVPGSSGTASYITVGLGNAAGLESSPHGAGRARSRTATKAIHDEAFVQAWLVEHDIHVHGVAPDETLLAYKDIETVMAGGAALFEPVIKLLPMFSMMDAGESDDGGG